jgi:HSP20 family molecular chaperone IbpA
LEQLLSIAATGTCAPLGMPMDVYRAGDGSYHVEADLPGVDPDSVEVLTITKFGSGDDHVTPAQAARSI